MSSFQGKVCIAWFMLIITYSCGSSSHAEEYTAESFMIDNPNGSSVIMGPPAVDFNIYQVKVGEETMIIYEGNHPQDDTQDWNGVEPIGGKTAWRAEQDGFIEYLIKIGGTWPSYLHIQFLDLSMANEFAEAVRSIKFN